MAKLLTRFLSNLKDGVMPIPFYDGGNIYDYAKSIYQQIETKRSYFTALSKKNANTISLRLQASKIRHESKMNALYRLLGLPSELDIKSASLLSPFKTLESSKDIKDFLLFREYEQLRIALYQDNVDLTQSLADEMLNPKNINTSRLFPTIQYSVINNICEPENRVAPIFAKSEERYMNGKLLGAPFIETVIAIRLLPSSGGSALNELGIVEEVILDTLASVLHDLVQKYADIMKKTEKLILEGVSTIRSRVPGITSPVVKAPTSLEGKREPNSPTVDNDVFYINNNIQLNLYSSILSLIPIDDNIIPTDLNSNGTYFSSRNLKNNELTGAFLSIIEKNKQIIENKLSELNAKQKKIQIQQDVARAEFKSILTFDYDITIVEVILLISALFIIDEEDLMGLIPSGRFEEITKTSASQKTKTESSTTKSINLFNSLSKFKDSRHSTDVAIVNYQNTVLELYNAFNELLIKAHTNIK